MQTWAAWPMRTVSDSSVWSDRFVNIQQASSKMPLGSFQTEKLAGKRGARQISRVGGSPRVLGERLGVG